jgi:hypothetical protein
MHGFGESKEISIQEKGVVYLQGCQLSIKLVNCSKIKYFHQLQNNLAHSWFSNAHVV